MRTSSASATSSRIARGNAVDARWQDRSGRLFVEFERPAKAMIRRAFRGAFSADEIDDIYSGAWLGVLRALAGREERLADEEVRSYVLTAVANQASRELRRRRRKPTAPLELVGGVADETASPDEVVVSSERSQLTRDLLASLPPRRRAVMLLRYGWGLEPAQVCRLVANLSPRAYRKEVSRGVDELTEKLRSVERGEWCADREPILKTYVAGLATDDQERQAKAHLAHCRSCSDFVARLSGHLHDLGGLLAVSASVEALGRAPGVSDRVAETFDRVRAAVGGLGRRDPSELGEVATGVATSGAARGGGAAGAGLFAQLAGAGAAGKAALACLGGGLAATVCVAAGIGPLHLDRTVDRSEPVAERAVRADHGHRAKTLTVETLPAQVVSDQAPPEAPAATPNVEAAAAEAQPREREQPATPVDDSAPAIEQEFGVAAAAAPAQPAPTPTSTGDGSGDSSSGGGASAVQQEFGP